MNGKKARALRKQANFDTKADRQYVVQIVRDISGRQEAVRTTAVNPPQSARAVYQRLKKAS
jgi:ribosomal 50S subunit-associated protein YjgA (DUF615 family)